MMKFSLNCQGRLLDLSTPVVMKIINLTPDSFHQSQSEDSDHSILSIVEEALINGAKIIDIGGQSTRPGAQLISKEVEWERIKGKIKLIQKEFSEAFISIDTFYSSVAEKAVDEGADIINDISGGSIDDSLFETVARLKVPYILMHIKGTPLNMQLNPTYENVVLEVWNYFLEKINKLEALGIDQVIIDPGFGFGKSKENNYSLLKNLPVFQNLHRPILAGVSRKSMITKVLNIKSEDALNGTTILNTLAIMNGASILRVHDVIPAQQVISLLKEYRNVQ